MTKVPVRATPRPSEDRRLRIGFILGRSFTLSPFALFVDVLRLASDEADRSGRVFADWQVLASSPQLITASCGVQVAPTCGLVDPAGFDFLVVVGGRLETTNPIDNETIGYLRKAASRGVCLIGLCTGTFILAECGLMRDHTSCVSWLHLQQFRERFPDHDATAMRLYSLDGERGSCAGGSSAADMAASIVRRQVGINAEKNALEVLQIDGARPGEHVQPRKIVPAAGGDARLRAVLIAMENNIERPLSIELLAASVGLSRRQLERLFMARIQEAPARLYKQLRLERARQRLAQSNAPVIEIALDTGFESASNFSRAFRSAFGAAPSAFRNATPETL
ncbi:MAG: GlxA family transcriptional regulator [Rhizobiaceae bacterium]|nr:GlxA family transcriptional regulator [Rhizobiaceae bacterium]